MKLARDGTDGRIPNLFFTTDVAGAIDEADLIFISVNTPTKIAGFGAGAASDLGYVESAARKIAEVARGDKIIVEKSTVPCGTASDLRQIFDSLAPHIHFDILSNPEFLAEGTAMTDLERPDRILIGSLDDSRSVAAAKSLAQVYHAWVPADRVVTINLWSSELAKLAANCMLAQRISSINSLSAMCEATGADIEELSYAIGLDARIGPKMLKASAGFGGSCFKKDVYSLVYIAESLHLPEVAQYWRHVVDINEYQKDRFAKRVTRALFNTLSHKRVAILGWAYKKNTGDTRESAAISIVSQLLPEQAQITVYDPQVPEAQIFADLAREHPDARKQVTVCTDALSACHDAAAIVILTEWDEFKTDGIQLKDDFSSSSESGSPTPDSAIDVSDTHCGSLKAPPILMSKLSNDCLARRMDWHAVAASMRRPRLVFDGRNVVQPEKLASLGFRVEQIGKAAVY